MSDHLTDINRQPVEWVEIDQPICTRVYGSSPCVAALGTTGAEKCHNTRFTCQDPDNYDQDVVTLRFTHNQARLPDDEYNFPYLMSAKVSPAKINPGGSNRNSGALGIRGTLSMTFSDHPHTDRIVDPYIDDRLTGAARFDGVGYDPYDRSTFWAKWKSRNPYYNHRVVRHVSAFLNTDPLIPDVIAGSKTIRTFFITDVTGPSASGSFSIKASDILALAFNDKAQYPQANIGKLTAGITAGSGSFTLIPADIGDDEYPASGKIRIDGEVISFTRASDVMTLTVRGDNNTTPDAHEANATAQLCVEYAGKAPDFVLNDLLTNGANIDTTYLDTVQWADEVNDHLSRLYSTVITEPTGITSLINEICEQMYFTAWWDDRNALLKIRALRPAEDETITELNDDQHLLEGATTWSDRVDDLLTRVFIYYSIKDYTKQLDDVSNYAAIDVVADPDSESEYKNNTAKIKKIFSRWIPSGSGAHAVDLGSKILERYNNIPREVKFSLDAKDSALWITDFITLQNRNNVDAFGISQPVAMQVISASESIQGTTFSYAALEYTGKTIEANPDEYLVEIVDSLLNVNLKTLYESQYAHVPISGDKIRFIVRTGAFIGGTAFSSDANITRADGFPKRANKEYTASCSVVAGITSYEVPFLQRKGIASNRNFNRGDMYSYATGGNVGYLSGDLKERPLSIALKTGSWATGVELFLDVESGGSIIGEGGNSSMIVLQISSPHTDNVPAGDGGYAMKITHDITINNLGKIGGGGGGGESAKYTDSTTNSKFCLMSGGGGKGWHNSIAGDEGDVVFKTYPSGGSSLAKGLGGKCEFIEQEFNSWVTEYSGKGGGLAQNGWNYNNTSQSGNVVGKAGDATESGASMITWVTQGNVKGTLN